MRRGDPANDRWARSEVLPPQGVEPGRPPVRTRRQPTDGTRWRTRTGAPWRDMPERYGPWGRVYDLFRRCGPSRAWSSRGRERCSSRRQ
ncbi:transposase [Streptomyces beigongshangae]|uniref:transposase n=1 Tax=Streptomyces beigongshangae TaxID=2841597 RepID=UPI003D315FE0